MSLKNFSVSQVETHLDCPRKHFFKSILKIPDDPGQAAMRGISIHKTLENISERLERGIELEQALDQHSSTDAPWMTYARAVAATGVLPKPGESHAREHNFLLDTHLDIPFKGVIDLVLEDRTPIDIIDYKSTSDIRYAKTPNELLTNLQLVVYAHYILTNVPDHDFVRTRLVYVEAKKQPLKTKLPRTVNVSVDLDRDHVRRIWQGDDPFVSNGKPHILPDVLNRIAANSYCTDFNDIEPITTTCTKYGGCPFRTQCGLSPFAGISSTIAHEPKKRITIEESKTMGFLANKNAVAPTNGTNGTAKTAPPPAVAAAPEATPAGAKPSFLNRAKAAASSSPAPGPGPVSEAARQAKLDQDFGPAKIPTGVVPSDAPARTNQLAQEPAEAPAAVETAPEAQDAPKKRGRPKKDAQAAGQAAIDAMDGEMAQTIAAAPRAAKNGRTSLTLYVDCLPTKGDPAVLFEDWFGTKLLELTSWAEEEEKVPDLRLVGFAKEKAALAIAANDLIKTNRPHGIIISTGNQMAKDVLGVLIPHADNVVRALRG